MFLFGSSKVLVRDLYHGITDIHSHILPGVDDGIQTKAESLQLLLIYKSLGVKQLWLTPHIMEDIPNTNDELKRKYDELLVSYQKITGSSTTMEIKLSAEYMIDNLFLERLKRKDLLPHGDSGDHLLIETSYYNPPCNLPNIISDILSAGFFPILAHPERYVYMDKSDYRKLKDMNVLFQLNLPSLAGIYGEEVKNRAEYLQKHSFYDFAGSDIHSLNRIDVLLNSKVKLFGKELF